MANNTIKAIRGMNDILPSESCYWQYLEKTLRQLLPRYGYQEIRTPIVEQTSLFKRTIGEDTDIVEKETYSFEDRNGDSLTLRPEGTANTVRAGIEHSLFYNQVQRLWYMGPYFRHERPQKGRYRQFHQLGVEAFGMAGPDIDIELLMMTWRLWTMLGLHKHLTLQLNTLGLPEERQAYREVLIEYFEKYRDQLDEDSVKRLHKNPLRILDSKNPTMQALIAQAPTMENYFGEASKEHFMKICNALDNADIPYVVNPRLVRGLDYYCHSVFEWVSEELGAQATVCAGGRYDNLVETIGGDATPGVGFAMGIERIILLLKHHGLQLLDNPQIYIVSDDESRATALALSEQIREGLPSLGVLCHCGKSSFKSQMKRADKSGAEIALIIGENERNNDTISVKFLRNNEAQEALAETALLERLATIFALGE
jgi:histidyl-tRNA synthetase